MYWTSIVSMICITILQIVALLCKVDGTTLGLVIAAIAGIGGYQIKAHQDNVKGGL